MSSTNQDMPSIAHLTTERPTSAHISGAALAFMLWEFFITFDDEIQYIWSKPNKVWIKWLYLFARYFPLATQIISRVVDGLFFFQHDVSYRAVYSWYICQVLVAAMSVMSLEVIMMARVYALYYRDIWIKCFFIALLISEVVLTVFGMTKALPGPNFKPSHIVEYIPDSFLYYAIAALSVQTAVLILSIVRYARGEMRRAPIVKLMIRDGVMSFILLAVFSMTMVHYVIHQIPLPAHACAWLISVVSCAGCRSIINMQLLPVHRDMNTVNTIQLSTVHRDWTISEEEN